MKILFLESNAWASDGVKAVVSSLLHPCNFEVKAVTADKAEILTCQAYDVIFFPFKLWEEHLTNLLGPGDQLNQYWVALVEPDYLEHLKPWLCRGIADYLIKDNLYLECLHLNLQRIINSAHKEIKLRNLENENQLLVDISDRKRLAAEQTRQADLLAGQREVLEAMVLGTPLPEILDQLIRILEAQTPGMFGSILLLRGQQLWHGAAPSLPAAYQQAIDGVQIGPQVGSCGTAAYLEEPIVVTDVATDPLWEHYRDLALAHGLRACWSVPIFSRSGKVLGTFAQYFQTPYKPDAQDWECMNIAVKLAGLAIEQHQSDQALKSSEVRFRAIFEQAAVGICQVSMSGQFLKVNQKLCQFLGYTREELETRTFQEITYPEDLALDLRFYHQILRGERSTFTLEKRYIRKDRTVVWSSLTVSLMGDDDGPPHSLLAVVKDITARKQAETTLQQLNQTLETRVTARTAALQQTNLQLQQALAERRMITALVDNSTSFIITATLEGQITYLNRVGRQLVGLEATADITRYKIADFHFPEDWPKLESTIVQPLLRGEAWQGEVRLRHFQTREAIPMTHNAFVITHPPTGEPMALAGILRDITELKQKETQLQEISQRLSLAVQSGKFGIWEFDIAQNRLIWDDRMGELYGITPGEFRGTLSDWEQRVHPDDLAQAQVVSEQAVRGERPYDTEFRVVHPGGEIRYIKAYAFHERNSEGVAMRAVGLNLDITDIKQAEAALQESEARYRLLMDKAGDAILLANTQGQFLDVNQEAIALLGYNREELLEMAIPQIHPPTRLENILANFSRLQENKSYPPITEVVLRKDGQQVPVEITVTVIKINGQRIVQGILRDVSERLRIEQELQHLRERLQFLLSASPAVIYTCRPDGDFPCTFISENVARVLGYSPEEWLAEPGFWVNHLHPEESSRVLAELSSLFDQGRHSHEYRLLHKKGHYVWVRDELRLIYDEQGQPLELVGYLANITDLKRAELALQQLNEHLEAQVNQRTRELQDQATLLTTILNSMGDGVVVADQHGEIILYNPAGKQITEIEQAPSRELTTWQSHWGIFLPDERPCPPEQLPLWRALQGESFDRVEVILRHQGCPQGRYLEVSGRPLEGFTNQPMGAVAVFRDVTDRKQSENQLFYNSLHDSLTDLPNRDLLTQTLDRWIQSPQRSNSGRYAVLFLDLDHFKVINDSLGHAVGDQMLGQVATALKSLTPPTGLAARLGGDEFVVLLDDVANLQAPIGLAKRILKHFKRPLTLDEREIFVKTSIGIVMGNPTYQTAADVLRDADIALYQAKAKGRNRYALFNEAMHLSMLERLQLEHDLRNALAQNELLVYYQPVIDIKHHRVAGFEALVRWHHPTQGVISPAKFIPLAEETGLIAPLDRWVLKTACHQLVAWQKQFPHYCDLTISTNLVVTDLMYPNILDSIDQILSETGINSQHLTLEITESMLIEQIQTVARVLDQIQARGIRVSIDDFGTGYSSLSYLHQLPVNAFKIDRSFVMNLETNHKNAEIVKTIITLSNRLGLKIIAEGIETEAQLQYLKNLNCDLGQGYLFAPPLAAAAATDFLANFSASS